jgi:lipid II:glycine glycyltransferase (peptidoglycan interpeptide bridge formation enzyme)
MPSDLSIDKSYSVQVDGISPEKWDEVLDIFEDASIYQTFAYGSVRWGSNNLSHIILKFNDEIVAAAQLVIKKIPLVKAGIAFSPWGPITRLRKDEFIASPSNHLYKILEELKKEYVLKRGLLFRCTPCDLVDNIEDVSTIYSRAGLKRDDSVTRYRTLVMDLTRSSEDIKKGIDQKWRNQLNKAIRSNIRVVDGYSDELYCSFLSMQKEMQDRKKYIPGVDYHEFREVQKKLPEKHKMKIFVGYNNDKPVCATICSHIGSRAIYLLGATADEGLKTNGSNLLQWKAIEWLKSRDCQWYDLGGISPEKNPGVYRFKNNLTGKNGKEIFHMGQFSAYSNILSWLSVMLFEKLKGLKRK